MSRIGYKFYDIECVFPWLENRLKILNHQGFSVSYQILLGEKEEVIVEMEITQ